MSWEHPCGFCGGPGGTCPGGGHTIHCPRYRKPKKRAKVLQLQADKVSMDNGNTHDALKAAGTLQMHLAVRRGARTACSPRKMGGGMATENIADVTCERCKNSREFARAGEKG